MKIKLITTICIFAVIAGLGAFGYYFLFKNTEKSINLIFFIIGILVILGGIFIFILEGDLIFSLSAIIPGIILA